jgi:phage shock protein PspC (stress-responsive transcriptional regulator)
MAVTSFMRAASSLCGGDANSSVVCRTAAAPDQIGSGSHVETSGGSDHHGLQMADRLYRSTTDRVLSGVAGGLAELWDLDPALVRVVWAVLVPLTGGLALLAYIVLAIVVPEGPPHRLSSAPSGEAESPTGPVVASAGTAAETSVSARRARGRGSTGLLAGVALILAGLYLLLQEYLLGFEPDRFWPFVLVGLGVVLLVMAAGRRGDGS